MSPGSLTGRWTQVQQYSMQDLQSALDKADGKAPGPNHIGGPFHQGPPGTRPVGPGPLLPGHPPRRPANNALEGRAHLAQPHQDDYRPIALGQLDVKLLTGPLTQRITEVLTLHGVVSDWQQGALPGSTTGPPLFMAQRQL